MSVGRVVGGQFSKVLGSTTREFALSVNLYLLIHTGSSVHYYYSFTANMKFLIDAFLGTLVSIALYFATLPAVNKQRQLVHMGLGPLNPYQIVYSVSSCLIWLVYGFMIDNWYVMIERTFGLTLYVYYALSCLGLMAVNWGKMNLTFGNTDGIQKDLLLSDIKAISTVQYILVSLVIIWVVVFAFLFNAYGLNSSVLGQICSINSIGYSVIRTPHVYIIARSKNTSTIILPLLVMDTLGSSAWFIYGIGISNTNFIYPNLVGLFYSAAYWTLYALYRNVVPDLSEFGQEVAIDKESGKVGFVRNSSRSRAASSYDPYRAASKSVSALGSDFGTRSRQGTMGEADDDPEVGSPMKDIPVNEDGEEKRERHASVFAATVGQLDSAMEYLVNIGQSRAHTILIDAVAAEEIAHVERLNEQLVPELACDVCSFCDGPVLVDAKFCSTCGTKVEGGTARSYSMQQGGDYASLLSLAAPLDNSPTKSNPTFAPLSSDGPSIRIPLTILEEEERPSEV